MTYAKAGVDSRHVRASHEVLARRLESTFQTRKRKVGWPLFPIGHYAGLVDLGDGRALSLHTDSVGTKVLVAEMMGRYDTIGIDCVAMCANDLICTGAEPISFLDYMAMNKPTDRLWKRWLLVWSRARRRREWRLSGEKPQSCPSCFPRMAVLILSVLRRESARRRS